ncbi:2-oxoglutarate and iron-dependent oxygenase domain-containing protein 3 [Ceratitis capitata]|uniref:2-oxoglutarate and iron-dependent oxygenase domain-containing protein 3 n=1 Tax=Ceratitis capitata TaxID=7213 RepID=W8BG30_CERCA|nr:2-oxoglutarate and iron-dependent oxygenase domain-containing protein 3 [Ceratitis capitata]XP_004533879.1 2-oxoglutarate and iron-dependent oxygenase domain-containing protein 3 [Ceratitis capitata]
MLRRNVNNKERINGNADIKTSNNITKAQSNLRNINAELQNATKYSTHRLWTRAVIATSLMVVVYFYSQQRHSKETKFALAKEKLPLRIEKFECSNGYKAEISRYPNCVPKKCGRFVSDQLVEHDEVEVLLDLASKILSMAGSSGGASVLNLHTGALSYKEQFVNAYRVPKVVAELKQYQLGIYNSVKNKIKEAIAEQFEIPASSLYLTDPTFFSRLTNATAKTMNDEYWHEHVDKDTYESFHYTSLLYLNTYQKDYRGGRFIFIDGNDDNPTKSAIEPKKARVSAFTSGAENLHHVEQVIEGERYAITISFTCDPDQAIPDLQIKNYN